TLSTSTGRLPLHGLTGKSPGSVLDEPESDLPVEGAEGLAVPGPAGAPGPGARQGARHPVHPIQVLAADSALPCGSTAGVPAVRGHDAAAGGGPDARAPHVPW